MTPGLCLDSGEFIPAAELNQRIEMKHELPPLLSHPEPHSMTWTAIEGRAIAEYAQQVAEPLLARIADLEANALGWLQANNPGGWIDDLRVRAESLEVQLASGQEAVHQFRAPHCSDWYDGHPDYSDGKKYETRVLYANLAPAQQPWIDEVMAQVQVFASAWSLVGGRFDNGDMLDQAELAKAELRAMLASKANP